MFKEGSKLERDKEIRLAGVCYQLYLGFGLLVVLRYQFLFVHLLACLLV